MDLAEWTLVFLKHQDLMKKEIQNVTQREEGDVHVITLEKKAGPEEWLVAGLLERSRKLLDPQRKQGIACLNTKENLERLLAEWQTFAQHPTLRIVFSNPQKNERWAITPAHHARVADKASLKTGLQAMFESVPAA